ncbi:MAG: serine/threonine protein kinase [Myxococcales bacterium]|nr:serine/threonine protein kinase [Myxococcales bacterium]
MKDTPPSTSSGPLLCKVCHREFVSRPEDPITSCPDDGAPLVPLLTDDPLLGTVLDGRFAIEELIGAGGMGRVYRAQQLSMKREVAVKVLPRDLSSEPDAVKRFLREAQAVSRISHPNAIVVHDFGHTTEGVMYLAMEFVRGRTLAELIHDKGGMDVPTVCEIAAQICAALAHSHGQQIIHRDLKPENVMVISPPGEGRLVKVLDFGLAKLREGDQSSTERGIICGTPKYMSPEQVMGDPVDPRSDIYSLGVLLYEMLSGAVPYHGDSPIGVAMQHIRSIPPPLAERSPRSLDPSLVELVHRCLARDPAERPQSADDLRRSLLLVATASMGQSPMLSGDPSSRPTISQNMTTPTPPTMTLPSGPGTDPRHRHSRALWLLVATMVVVLALAVAVHLSKTGTETNRDPGGRSMRRDPPEQTPPPPRKSIPPIAKLPLVDVNDPVDATRGPDDANGGVGLLAPAPDAMRDDVRASTSEADRDDVRAPTLDTKRDDVRASTSDTSRQEVLTPTRLHEKPKRKRRGKHRDPFFRVPGIRHR